MNIFYFTTLYPVFNCMTLSLDEVNDGPLIETMYEEENDPEYLGEVCTVQKIVIVD